MTNNRFIVKYQGQARLGEVGRGVVWQGEVWRGMVFI